MTSTQVQNESLLHELLRSLADDSEIALARIQQKTEIQGTIAPEEPAPTAGTRGKATIQGGDAEVAAGGVPKSTNKKKKNKSKKKGIVLVAGMEPKQRPGTQNPAAPGGAGQAVPKSKDGDQKKKKTATTTAPPYSERSGSDDSDYDESGIYHLPGQHRDLSGSDDGYSESDSWKEEDPEVPRLYISDKHWEVLEPFCKPIKYHVTEKAFMARVDKLVCPPFPNMPPPLSEPTLREMTLEKAFELTRMLSYDKSAPEGLAIKAAEITRSLALAGRVRPYVICDVARLHSELLAKANRLQEAEEAAGLAYVAAMEANVPLQQSQAMKAFGSVWSAKKRFEPALIAYKAAATLVQGTPDACHPSVMNIHAGIAYTLREIGDNRGALTTMLNGCIWMLKASEQLAKQAQQAQDSQRKDKGLMEKIQELQEPSPSELKELASEVRKHILHPLKQAAQWLQEPGASAQDKAVAEAALAEARDMAITEYGRESLPYLRALDATALFFQREGQMDMFFDVQNQQLDILEYAPEVQVDEVWLGHLISIYKSMASGKAEQEDYQAAIELIDEVLPDAKDGVRDGVISNQDLVELYDIMIDLKRKAGDEAGAKAVMKKKQKAANRDKGQNESIVLVRTAKHKKRGKK